MTGQRAGAVARARPGRAEGERGAERTGAAGDARARQPAPAAQRQPVAHHEGHAHGRRQGAAALRGTACFGIDYGEKWWKPLRLLAVASLPVSRFVPCWQLNSTGQEINIPLASITSTHQHHCTSRMVTLSMSFPHITSPSDAVPASSCKSRLEKTVVLLGHMLYVHL